MKANFAEDKRVLKATGFLLDGGGRGADCRDFDLTADTPQLHARHKLAQWLDRD